MKPPSHIRLTIPEKIAKELGCPQTIYSTMRIEMDGKVQYVCRPVGVVTVDALPRQV